MHRRGSLRRAFIPAATASKLRVHWLKVCILEGVGMHCSRMADTCTMSQSRKSCSATSALCIGSGNSQLESARILVHRFYAIHRERETDVETTSSLSGFRPEPGLTAEALNGLTADKVTPSSASRTRRPLCPPPRSTGLGASLPVVGVIAVEKGR